MIGFESMYEVSCDVVYSVVRDGTDGAGPGGLDGPSSPREASHDRATGRRIIAIAHDIKVFEIDKAGRSPFDGDVGRRAGEPGHGAIDTALARFIALAPDLASVSVRRILIEASGSDGVCAHVPAAVVQDHRGTVVVDFSPDTKVASPSFELSRRAADVLGGRSVVFHATTLTASSFFGSAELLSRYRDLPFDVDDLEHIENVVASRHLDGKPPPTVELLGRALSADDAPSGKVLAMLARGYLGIRDGAQVTMDALVVPRERLWEEH